MIFLLLLTVLFSILTDTGGLGIHYVQDRDLDDTSFKNGSTFIFISIMDKSVITVQANGEVTTEEFINSPEQKWTVVPHPYDSYAFEFKQSVVPYNTLSGFEDPPDNPGIFPRPLGLFNHGAIEHVEAWNILIRGRWCIQANGYGYPMDMDDCEDFVAPWQLWQLEEVSP